MPKLGPHLLSIIISNPRAGSAPSQGVWVTVGTVLGASVLGNTPPAALASRARLQLARRSCLPVSARAAQGLEETQGQLPRLTSSWVIRSPSSCTRGYVCL